MAISLLLLAKGRATQSQLSFAQGRYGYGTSRSQRALSAGLAFGIAGTVGAALIAALTIPDLLEHAPTIITGRQIPIERPIDPVIEPPIERPATPAETHFTVTPPLTNFPTLGNPPVGDPVIGFIPPPDPTIGTGIGGGEAINVIPIPEPVLRDATRDPRFAASFQPAYPPALEREGVTGTARVRVRIGTNGRVISVENLSATDPAFFAATERQALRHWRFRPATRDGVPIESEQVLTVRFQVPERD